MTHRTARQRAARAKRDKFRAAQIAPSHPMPPVVCATCGHLRGLHDLMERDPLVECLAVGCDCTEYREASDGTA